MSKKRHENFFIAMIVMFATIIGIFGANTTKANAVTLQCEATWELGCFIPASDLGGTQGGVYFYLDPVTGKARIPADQQPATDFYGASYVGNLNIPNMIQTSYDESVWEVGYIDGTRNSDSSLGCDNNATGPWLNAGVGALGTVYIPNTVLFVSECAFANSGMTSLAFGDGGSAPGLTINTEAFRNNPQMGGTINFPSQTRYIGNDAFFGNIGVAGISFTGNSGEIPLTLVTSFIGMTGLAGSTVDFPANLTHVEGDVLGNGLTWNETHNTGVVGITFADGTTPLRINGAFNFMPSLSGNIHFPSRVIDVNNSFYTGSGLSSDITGITFDDSDDLLLHQIRNSFNRLNNLKSITLPSHLRIIESSFYENNALVDVTINDGDRVPLIIQENTFANSHALENLTLPSRLVQLRGHIIYSWYGNETLSFERVYIYAPNGADQVGGDVIGAGINGATVAFPENTIVHVTCAAYPSFDNQTTGTGAGIAGDGMWRGYELATLVTVSFDNGGRGLEYNSISNVGCNQSIEEPYQPEVDEDGYEFLGWFYEDGTPVNFDAVLSGNMMIKDITVYAQWEKEDSGGDNTDTDENENNDKDVVDDESVIDDKTTGGLPTTGNDMLSLLIFVLIAAVSSSGILWYIKKKQS